MTWVKTFTKEEASGRLAEVYQEVMQNHPMAGRLPPVISCMGLRPEALINVFRLNMGVTFGSSTLGRVREEMVATAVSASNGCHY